MLCENCKTNTATVHVKGFALGMKAELHLCQECSQNMANMVNMDNMPVSLENIFKGIMESVQSQMGMPLGQQIQNPQVPRKTPGPCGVCGLSYDQFKTTGKLGCDECYKAFPKEILALFKNVQGSSHHEGKYPKRFGSQIRQQREVDKLRTSLKQAIDEENYEEAAKIRDQIRQMEVNP